jgi:25S rRNA (uracil2634-N3)-methyltransferase
VFLRASSDCKMGHGASSSSSSEAHDQQQQEEAKNKVGNEENKLAIESIVPKCNEQRAKEDGEAKTSLSYPQDNNTVLQHNQTTPPNPAPRVLFSIDGRKLGTAAGGGKKVRNGFPPPPSRRRKVWHRRAPKNQDDNNNSNNNRRNVSANGGGGGPWDIICFNFPHVGGLSTDVNRQVRANQELLVAFFDACLPLLAVSAPMKLDGDDSGNDYTESDDDDDDDIDPTVENNAGNCKARTGRAGSKTGPGQILVTLFEGEPYTLWNIRDLARHAGLRVVTSFRFPWKSYPGYSHARTLGVIENRRGDPSGWRGQDREARTYVFEAKGASHEPPVAKTGKKRPRREESADSSSE